MLDAAGPALSGRVLELGAGTGSFTRALLRSGVSPERLTVVEYDPVFAAGLRRRFPGIAVLEVDAFLPQTIEALGPFDVVLSGLPLLNFPREKSADLIQGLLANASAGAPFVQFTYGPREPVPPPPGVATTRIGRVWRNLPPATVWAYRLNR
jgi:phosphatidylethanolamine/phosphatidyl-N-methylethanolamine N-methyltransferase